MSEQVTPQKRETSSPDSDGTRTASAAGLSSKKRPSRAGTRSVSTLSAAQLERKRANDREAQRAIRQRTKEHIEKLEKRITELTASEDGNGQLVGALQRIKDLEQENAFLKMKLQEASVSISLSPSASSSPWDESVPNRTALSAGGLQYISQAPVAQSSVAPGGPQRSNSYPYSSQGQWEALNSYAVNSSIKREETSSASTEIQQEPMGGWSVDQARAVQNRNHSPLYQNADYQQNQSSGYFAASRSRNQSWPHPNMSGGQNVTYHAGQMAPESSSSPVEQSSMSAAQQQQYIQTQQQHQHQHQQQQQQQHHQQQQQQQQQQQYQHQTTQQQQHQQHQQMRPLPMRTQGEQQPQLYYGRYSNG